MVRYCLCALAGAWSLYLFDRLPADWLLAAAAFPALACLALPRLRMAGAFLVGLAVMSLAARHTVGQRLSPDLEGRTVAMEVEIADFPQRRGDAVRLLVEPVGADVLPDRVRLSWYRPATLPAIGETWRLDVRLRRPRGFANPGGFDYEGWLFRNGIGATGYVVEGGDNRRIEGRRPGVLTRYRRDFAQRIVELLPGDDATAVLLAITVGARHRISRSQWDRYARSGLSHLMAISGLHIGLAAGSAFAVAWGLLSIFCTGSNVRDLALFCAVAAAAAYALLSGFAVPARRAMVMAILFAIAMVCRRQLAPSRGLAMCCLLLLGTDPLAALSPGFKLSFTAVACLFWVACHTSCAPVWLPPGRTARFMQACTRLGVMQMALLFGLFPLTALIFARATLVAPIANLLALPVFNLVTVPAGLLAMLFDPFSRSAADLFLRIAHVSIAAVLYVVGTVAELPGAGLTVRRLSGAILIGALLPALWVMIPRGWPGRHIAWVAIAATLLYRPPAPPDSCIDITVLDVGQGLAAVLRTSRHTVVYDTGPVFRSGGNAAELVVLPFLAAQGIRKIDLLVVSHADLDHAGGIESLTRRIPVRRILAGETLPAVDAAYDSCRAGGHWFRDGVRFAVLHPDGERRWAGNDASCVLQVDGGDFRMLLTGDIEAAVERQLLRRGLLGQSDLVIVPHHGSRTSSSAAFVDTLQARTAVVSSGYRNRWGFPKPDVAARWRDSGALVLTTADAGAISQRLCTGGEHGPIRRQRTAGRQFWSDPGGSPDISPD